MSENENKEVQLALFHYQQRRQEVSTFYHKLRTNPLLGIHVRGEVKLPYNIKYHNDDCAFIEIAVAGYGPDDIKAEIKGTILSVYTSNNHFGTSLKEDNTFLEYDRNYNFLDGSENITKGLDRDLYVLKGITSKPFNLNFHIPADHEYRFASKRDGILTFGFNVNLQSLTARPITID
jgi:HSP20 family molecular chaperone IbpA